MDPTRGWERRVAAVSRHLTAGPSGDAELTGAVLDTFHPTAHFRPDALYDYITADSHELRARVFDFLKDPVFQPNSYLTIPEFRELTLQRLKLVCGQKFFSVADYTADPLRFMAVLECLAFCDYSLAIKGGVHFTLCGGTLNKLGTTKHHKAYFAGMDSLELPGCFGMTELGHGSNVMGIETTAEWDPESGGFVIHTPNDTASKFWIGGAAQHAKICTVFAQLSVKGVYQGPHAFIVRLRDDHMRLIPGVRIEDNGAKMGLNGVDNGRIWFYHVHVPNDSLLDKFAQVSPDGAYWSSIPSVSARFGATVGGLTTGRMLIAQAAVDAAKIGVTIAVRYGCSREQFGGRVIMDYPTHQVIHVLSSGLKAACTWTRSDLLQHCRECCGGMGFLAANRIGTIKTDMDVDTTFEGDNTVLMQQVGKELLHGAAASAPHRPAPPGPPRAGAEGEAGGMLGMLRFREAWLVAEIGGDMHAASRGLSGPAAAAAAAAAFDARLEEVVQLGWAHVERNALEVFARAAEEAPSPDLRRWMGTLCSLYGLSRVEGAAAEYLIAGALRGEDVTRVRRAVRGICSDLVKPAGGGGDCAALALCKGFGIPDHLLMAPIAFDWAAI